MPSTFYGGQLDYVFWLNLIADICGLGEKFRFVDGIVTPVAIPGYAQIYVDIADGVTKVIHGDGTIVSLEAAGGGAYTDEEAQDAIGYILADSGTIQFSYDDVYPLISAIVRDGSVTFAKMQDVTESRLIGRGEGAGDGPPEEISLGSGLALVGTVLDTTGGAGYTDEQAQDAVAAILEPSSTIEWVYDDAYPTISAFVKPGVAKLMVVDDVAYAASLALDWTEIDEWRIGAMTGSLDITAMTGLVDGGRYILKITQDGTGGRSFTISATNVRFSEDIPEIVYSTTANKSTLIGFRYDASAGKLDVVAIVAGF